MEPQRYFADLHGGAYFAMFDEGVLQGWLTGNLKSIPELLDLFPKALAAIEREPGVEVLGAGRHLFGKAVEAVIRWGPSTNGKVTVTFEPVRGSFETGLPAPQHAKVLESLPVGESICRAYQAWIAEELEAGRTVDEPAERRRLLKCAWAFGICYALYHGLQDA